MDEYLKHAMDFLNKHNIEFSIELGEGKPAKWNPSGDHYVVRMTKKNPRKQITFDFWGSYHDMQEGITPNEYDILACISGNAFFTSAEEVYFEFGNDAQGMDVNAIVSFAKKLNNFFTDEELESLGEIR